MPVDAECFFILSDDITRLPKGGRAALVGTDDGSSSQSGPPSPSSFAALPFNRCRSRGLTTSVVIRPCSCHRIPRTAGSGAIGDGYHPSDRIRRWRTAPRIVEDDDVVLSSLTLITKHTPNISYQTSKRSNDGTISCESPLVSRQLINTLKFTPSSVLSTTTLYYLLCRQLFQPI